MDVVKVSFDQIANFKDDSAYSLADQVIVYENNYLMGQQVFDRTSMPPIRIEAVVFFICRYGEVSFTVDYKSYCLKQGYLLCLNNRHILDNIKISNNYKGYALFISPSLIQIIAGEIPNVSQFAMSAINSQPLAAFEKEEIDTLIEIILRIKKSLSATEHTFQSRIIKNEVSNFIFELTDIVLKKSKVDEIKNTANKTHGEETMMKFVQLILEHCKEQHKVSFYAKKLNMTAGNLSRITKATNEKSAITWINNALIAEAKILLRKPNTNIQLVSEELHFGDQSTFGKFFKKHTGYTPVEYRNKDK